MVGPPGGAPGQIALTEQARAAKSEKTEGGDKRGGEGESESEKFETDAIFFAYIRDAGGRTRSPSRVIVRLDLERGCSPRRTHEAESTATTLVISATAIISHVKGQSSKID